MIVDPRSVKAKFIGYDSNSTAYILQELTTKKIIKTHNVLFKEDEIQPLFSKEEIYQGEAILESPNLDLDDKCPDQTKVNPTGDEVGEIRDEVREIGNEVPDAPDQPQDEEDVEEAEESLPRENRNRRPPERYGNPYTFNTTQEEQTVAEPKTYEEAAKSRKAKFWKQAMQAEVESPREQQHLDTC